MKDKSTERSNLRSQISVMEQHYEAQFVETQKLRQELGKKLSDMQTAQQALQRLREELTELENDGTQWTL